MLQNGDAVAIFTLNMAFLPRFLPVPESSFFLFGPRGTGKTTWLRETYPSALTVNLLRPDTFREFSARPERLHDLVQGAPPESVVVVDEVQRVPELLSVVHDLMEGPDRRQFVLTGSRARKLRRGGADLLAGRALVKECHPFLAGELPDFDLERALLQGMIPLVYAASDPADTLRAYVGLYLEEEVRMEGWVRNVGDFSRFLEAVSFSHGQPLNVSNVARECQVRRKTVEGYLEVLEDLLLGFRLPVFARRASRSTTSHPKFYLFDTGVFRSLRPRGPLDRPEEIDGGALEGLVAQHLRALVSYRNLDEGLFFWRTRAGAEVDFVVYGPGSFWAIEVKNTRKVRPEDLRGLRSFRKEYPEAECILLYRGDERLRSSGVLCIPVEGFLGELHPEREFA
jgi:predicted AAA+ superfamily ATPase